jgi:hypothetical protein
MSKNILRKHAHRAERRRDELFRVYELAEIAFRNNDDWIQRAMLKAMRDEAWEKYQSI